MASTHRSEMNDYKCPRCNVHLIEVDGSNCMECPQCGEWFVEVTDSLSGNTKLVHVP